MARSNRLLINSVDCCVDEMLQGVVDGNPGQVMLEGHRVVLRSDIQKVKNAQQVTVICGGGSGHEPFAAGFVGEGMLSAAVAGAVFASPPPNDILAAIKAVESPAGTLVIVANYTGDRLNFGIAVERAKALGIKVTVVVVGEDCALQSTDKTAGRRGLVGIVNIMKIAGALAEQGKSLQDIANIASSAVKHMGTIGVSLSACSVPGTGPSFDLPDTEMEVGLGAHGEAGVKRMKLVPADQIVEILIDHMTDINSPSHLSVDKGDKVAIIMNNLGGLSELEMYVLSRKVIEYVESKGIWVVRSYFGHFMTSIDMAGFNLNITKLDNLLTACLDFPTCAPAWPNLRTLRLERASKPKMKLGEISSRLFEEDVKSEVLSKRDDMCIPVLRGLEKACHALISNESHLNELDTGAGDGDCGTTFKRGAKLALSKLASFHPKSVPEILQFVATCAEESMGGASGGIYSLLFTTASSHLIDAKTLHSWYSALLAGVTAVSRYGGAEPGDRTMLDGLVAIQQSLETSVKEGTGARQAILLASQSAAGAAEATVNMRARAGRASYVAAHLLTKPDAGAVGVSIWMKAVADACSISR